MSKERPANAEHGSERSMEGKYLTFKLAKEEFGIGILTVKEIIGMMAITPIPHTPDWGLGVINLRGKIIPVVDLRLKFSMESRPFDERTCIVVVEVLSGGELLSIGLVVDAVNEVANVRENEVEATPSFGIDLDTKYILGMAKTGNQVRILLDMDRVLGSDELSMLRQAA
jgi:purine-binding chemotaxis protein CheW